MPEWERERVMLSFSATSIKYHYLWKCVRPSSSSFGQVITKSFLWGETNIVTILVIMVCCCHRPLLNLTDLKSLQPWLWLKPVYSNISICIFICCVGLCWAVLGCVVDKCVRLRAWQPKTKLLKFGSHCKSSIDNRRIVFVYVWHGISEQ